MTRSRSREDSSLETLDIGANPLRQPLPSTFPSMLKHLNLSSAQLNGTVTAAFEGGNLIFAQSVDLSSNELSGTLPDDISLRMMLASQHHIPVF